MRSNNQNEVAMKASSQFDSAADLPKTEANRWHERVLMVVVVAAMVLSLIGFIHR